MKISRFLGLVGLPLAACLPRAVERDNEIQPQTGSSSTDAAQFDFKPYVLRNTCFDCARQDADALFSCDMKFEWFDPNSVKENNVTSCKCSYKWAWDGVTSEPGDKNTFDPNGYFVCYQGPMTTFQMRLKGFTGPSNISLEMSHQYKDSSLFGPGSLNIIHTFAVNSMTLMEIFKKEHAMTYFLAGPTMVNITGLI